MTTSDLMARLSKMLLICTVLVAPIAQAQETTEQYIPIGKSPGISGKYSYIGVVVAIDRDAHTIDVESDRGTKTIRVTENTRMWLDRSKARRTNPKASYADCEIGVTVEVMYTHDDQGTADWIKIESR